MKEMVVAMPCAYTGMRQSSRSKDPNKGNVHLARPQKLDLKGLKIDCAATRSSFRFMKNV